MQLNHFERGDAVKEPHSGSGQPAAGDAFTSGG
jgi:hypothetical protein